MSQAVLNNNMTHHISPILNFILAIGSFAGFLVLAFFQNITDLAVYKDIGMGAAFIATCFFMFRYFTTQIEKKDETQNKMNDRFLDVIEKKITSDAEIRLTIGELVKKVDELHKFTHRTVSTNEQRK